MTEAIQVYRHDFDVMENRDPKYSILLGTFSDRSKVTEFLKEMNPVKFYLGWNNKVYPKFEIKKIKIN